MIRKISIAFLILCSAFATQAQTILSKSECRAAQMALEAEWRNNAYNNYAQAIEDNVFTSGDLKLKIKPVFYGDKPADGRSLYISLHGGGGTTTDVNDQQWRNQMYLYKPEEGVYVAPRAPWDAWNMWFQEGIDELFEMLIQAAVAHWEVNPDKVYLLGYSAGGDGVWRMAPRMADRWAAASMMAGHPGEASQVNLRNTPFMIWMGENDAAYNRNTLAVKHGAIMDSLQTADPAGYVHQTHIIKGKGHWMDRVDAQALPWMAQFRRNPYPEKIVWRQELVARTAMYWLSAPKEECKHGSTVIVERKGNVIDISQCDYSCLTLYLNDEMFNLDRPIEVRYQGKRIFKGRVPRTSETLQQTLAERGDLRYCFPAKVEVKISKE
jgi:poly(3-hydroxybutyrate) depolymerase